MSVRIRPGFAASVCLMAWVDGGFCLNFLLALLVHELGHGIAMAAMGVPILGIRFQAGGAVITGDFRGYGSELLCALAGPLAGILASVLCCRWASDLAVISACLSVGNLLPLYPLDGGRILRAALLMGMDLPKAEGIMKIATGVTCCLLMIGACWAAAVLQSGLWPVFAALTVLWRAGTARTWES